MDQSLDGQLTGNNPIVILAQESFHVEGARHLGYTGLYLNGLVNIGNYSCRCRSTCRCEFSEKTDGFPGMILDFISRSENTAVKSEKRAIEKGDRLSFSGAYWSVVVNGGHLLKRRIEDDCDL